MSELKWTPGPWQRGEEHELKVEIQEASPPYRLICTAHGTSVLGGRSPDWTSMQANAALISAAPDMYRELERMLTEDCRYGEKCSWHRTAWAVLRKASGE
jgi:hypothetical protein